MTGARPRLHLGSGKRHLPGYVHIDLDRHPHIDHRHDIRTLPMFADGSVEEIYCCGTFEYFDREGEVPAVLAEWRRVLRRGGMLRLSVPDLAGIVRVYERDRNADGPGVLGPLFGRIVIDAGGSKQVLFHKTVYDEASLTRVLAAAGFEGITRYDWREFLPAGFDDYSAAYHPREGSDRILLSLNLSCHAP